MATKTVSISTKRAAAESAPANNDPVIDKADIQGDILLGLTKTAEIFLFFQIKDVPKFKCALHSLACTSITSVQDVLDAQIAISLARAAPAGSDRLHIRQANIAFSFAGIKKLIPGVDASKLDAEFKVGASGSAATLHDPVKNAKPVWDADFVEDHIDGVLLVTGESEAAANEHLAVMLAAFASSVTKVKQHVGKLREGLSRGREHFGFEDGISQPGIRGITARENPLDENQGVPGQDLLWPGEFVFGYPEQGADSKDVKGPKKSGPLPWMNNGAFMVFRKLNQAVPEFHDFLRNQAVAQGMTADLLGARLVGRWPSGAPVMKAPLQEDPFLAQDRLQNNDFEFLRDDPEQRKCPYAAHIRKTYPRDDTGTPPGDPEKAEADVQKHRIRRAGIPYGPETSAEEEEDGKTAAGKERGLTFVAYMTSIKEQFEFIQGSWANNPGFVFGKTRPAAGGGGAVSVGIDAIIGQPAPAQSGQPPQLIKPDEVIPNYPTGNVRSFISFGASFVTPRAAGYYFTPSLSALKGALSN